MWYEKKVYETTEKKSKIKIIYSQNTIYVRKKTAMKHQNVNSGCVNMARFEHFN